MRTKDSHSCTKPTTHLMPGVRCNLPLPVFTNVTIDTGLPKPACEDRSVMRSLGEILFRFRQEAANLWLYRRSPEFAGPLESPLPELPHPKAVADALRGSAFQSEVEAIADSVLAHCLPILDTVLDAGPEIRWRRDYVTGIESDKPLLPPDSLYGFRPRGRLPRDLGNEPASIPGSCRAGVPTRRPLRVYSGN